MPKRQMDLTPELLARVARVVEDAGPGPGVVYLTDADYDEIVGLMLAEAPEGDLWLFGYGWLLRKPGFQYTERRMATVRGWYRAFCIRSAS